ncbi:MAG TPA: c-type cytochrome [Flavisolibacter sp.]|nr:c-type cytochrome [Flavisolibacter sp.]
MTRSLLVICGFALFLGLSLAFTGYRPDDPGYRNLQVLPKNISKAQLDSVMRHFTSSLNVKCGFCHVRNDSTKAWDHASDGNKHKLIARDMMVMTNRINDEYFNYTGAVRDINTNLMVTCYTCHNGSKEPVVAPNPVADSIRRNK